MGIWKWSSRGKHQCNRMTMEHILSRSPCSGYWGLTRVPSPDCLLVDTLLAIWWYIASIGNQKFNHQTFRQTTRFIGTARGGWGCPAASRTSDRRLCQNRMLSTIIAFPWWVGGGGIIGEEQEFIFNDFLSEVLWWNSLFRGKKKYLHFTADGGQFN